MPVNRVLFTARGSSSPPGPGLVPRLALSRAEVEALAKQTNRYRRHINDPGSYWVTNERAAAILGVNRARLNQLAAADLIPFEAHRDGTRLYRRQQLMTVANARHARWGNPAGGHWSRHWHCRVWALMC